MDDLMQQGRVELQRLGHHIRQVRERHGMSADELASRTGIEAQRIRDLEIGQLDPDYEMLIELARGLGVRSAELVPEE